MAAVGRPRTFDEATVVHQAMDVFWRRGYAATSVQDLVDALGIQRGSLYAAFGSKEELLLRAIAHYSARTLPVVDGLRGTGPVVPHLRAYLEGAVAHATDDGVNGCLVGNSSVELAASDPAVAAAVRSAFAAIEQVLGSALARAYDSGELPRRDAAVQARMLVAVEQGLEILSRTTDDPADLAAVVEATLAGLRS